MLPTSHHTLHSSLSYDRGIWIKAGLGGAEVMVVLAYLICTGMMAPLLGVLCPGDEVKEGQSTRQLDSKQVWFICTHRAGLFISTGMVSLSIPRGVICLYPKDWSVYTCRGDLSNTLTGWSVYTGQSISSYTDQWWPSRRGSWSTLARVDLSLLVRAGLEGSGMRLPSSDMVGLSTLVSECVYTVCLSRPG